MVFGKRAGEYAAKFARDNASYSVSEGEVETAAVEALAPLEREVTDVGPFKLQYDLQTLMQNKVGIAREDGSPAEGPASASSNRVCIPMPGIRRAHCWLHCYCHWRHLPFVAAGYW